MQGSASTTTLEAGATWPHIAERLAYLQPRFPAAEVALASAHWDEAGPA